LAIRILLAKEKLYFSVKLKLRSWILNFYAFYILYTDVHIRDYSKINANFSNFCLWRNFISFSWKFLLSYL